MSKPVSKYRPVNTGPDATIRDLMKAGTKDLHDVADTLVETTLLKKRMSPQTYGTYLSGLYVLYTAMEEQLDNNADHQYVGPLYFQAETHRKLALERDLEYFLGPSWQDQLRNLDSIDSYVAHINDIGKRRPELLIPHAYVRYFGDMSGGQVLKKILSRLYQLPSDGSGAAFYDFSHIAKISDFKNLYSARLNDLSLSEECRQDLVEEARTAFRFNIAFLNEIVEIAESTPGGYLVTDDDSVIPELAEFEHHQPPEDSTVGSSTSGWGVFSRFFKPSLFVVGSLLLLVTLAKRSDDSIVS